MKLLVVVAVVCVPWMLASKPVYLLILHKNRTKVSLSSLFLCHTGPFYYLICLSLSLSLLAHFVRQARSYQPFSVQSADSDGETEAMVKGGVEPGDDEEEKGGVVHAEEVWSHDCHMISLTVISHCSLSLGRSSSTRPSTP